MNCSQLQKTADVAKNMKFEDEELDTKQENESMTEGEAEEQPSKRRESDEEIDVEGNDEDEQALIGDAETETAGEVRKEDTKRGRGKKRSIGNEGEADGEAAEQADSGSGPLLLSEMNLVRRTLRGE